MGLIETLSKEYPVPYKRTRDMSDSEYMKLVDRNTDLLDENKTLKEEIERLKEDNEYLNKVNIELSTEKNRLNNIIKEVRERLIKPSKFIERTERLKLLEMLDKESK